MKPKNLLNGLSSVGVVLIVFAILGTDCLMSYSGTVNSLLGISTSQVINEEGNVADTLYFESEYGELNAENLQKLIADTYEQSVTEEEEGAVLLKNESNALPLAENETRVTLFGHAAVQPLYKSHSGGSSGYTGEYCIDLYTALETAGFAINDTLYKAYQDSSTARLNGSVNGITLEQSEWAIGEEDISFYTDELRQSWEDDYNDAAIVILAREGGEGSELYQEDPAEGISQLALHQEEKDLLRMIQDSGNFEKTIVLINSGNAMELGWLDEYGVDACLWIGLPGQRGFEGVANILTGNANPSGHLVDTYAENSLSAPALVNGSYGNQNWTNLQEVLDAVDDRDPDISWYTVQAEGIYIGYKYYETRYEDAVLGNGNADSVKGSSTGTEWNYNNEVTYPFGYGMSYTTFEQKLDSVEANGDVITVKATVTNTGNIPGKSTLQVYAQTPYGDYEKENLVEKSAIQLLDFGKTELLAPGESQTLTVECDKYLLASYDYTNAKSYIMSEGDYYVAIGDHAHDALNNVLAAKGAEGMTDIDGAAATGDADKTYSWTEQFDGKIYATSQYTGEEVTNQFDDCDINYWQTDSVTYLSRNDWDATYPMEAVQVEATEEMIEVIKGEYYEKPEDALSVSDYTQGANQAIPLAALIGKEYDDGEWETYLNQFTIEELASLIAENEGTGEVASVGVPAVVICDGPDGLKGTFSEEKYGDGRDACCYPCENVLASTFNKDLCRRRGELMGEEAMYRGMPAAWHPGGNLHRTPFGGRNFEYYSEDANMSYLCSIPEVQGIESKGVHAGGKHLVGNDQENNREGISVFFNEQALREGPLRAFEGMLTIGGGKIVMQAFNRLGMKWSSANPALCTQVLRNEWGYTGKEVTDAIILTEGCFKNHYSSVLTAGTTTFCIDFESASANAIVNEIKSNDDGYLLGVLREAVHRYLYILANSVAMNGYSVNSKVVSVTPWWQPTCYAVIAVCVIVEILLLILLMRNGRKAALSGKELQ